jgi:hypothetical protein
MSQFYKSFFSFVSFPKTSQHAANFAWAPRFKLHAKQIHCTAGVGADKGHKMHQ